MATAVDFSGLTTSNQGFTEVKQLIFTTIFEDSPITKVLTVKTNMTSGEYVGLIVPLDEIGKPRQSACAITWDGITPKASQQQWSINPYAVNVRICADSLQSSFAKWSLKTGLDRDNLTSTDYMSYIVQPLFEDALARLVWRLAWFGDESALNVTDGGNITDGLDVDLFTNNEGLWKRLFAIGTATPARRTVIAANAETTLALQKSKLLEEGVALDLMTRLKADAPLVLRNQAKAGIFMTLSIADALDADIKRNNGSELQWKSIMAGLKMTTWDGIKIIASAEWDLKIATFNSKGTTYLSPHRAVYTLLENMQMGCLEKNALAQFKTWYDEKDHYQYIEAAGSMGTMVPEDGLLQLAY